MSNVSPRQFLAAFLAFVCLATTAEAANLAISIQRVDASQFPKVRVYASVATDRGIPIADLEQDRQAFQVFEDDKPVDGLTVDAIVASQEPIAVALVMDVSGSMNDGGKIDAAKGAAVAFVDTLGAKDTVAVVSFANEVTTVQDFTGDKAALKGAIGNLKANGATLLYDAVAQSAQLVGAVPQQRKVVLLLTDGEDETSKKTNLDGAIGAAKDAGTPIFAIGLGKDVKRDVLDKLAAGSAGQATYVADAAQLRPVFLSFGEQLRRQYVLQYNSKLVPDDKASHSVNVKVQYRGEAAEAKGSFALKRTSLAVDVKGIADKAQVTGVVRVEAALISGLAQRVELLVDDLPRGSATAAPFAFPWDTSKEKPGQHVVIVRATDQAGVSIDRKYTVEVIGPPPTVAPTAGPAPTQPPLLVATATPVPAKAADNSSNMLLYALGGILVLGTIGGGTWFALSRRKRMPTPVAVAAPKRDVGDDTRTLEPDPTKAPVVEPIAEADGATIISRAPLPPPRPRAKLRIVGADGAERDIALTQDETIIGREPASPVVVADKLASRKHAKVVLEKEQFWIEDLNSTNHTSVNGEIITRRQLSSGDQIKIGGTVLTFRRD